MPCEICGELTTFREGPENTARRHGGHTQGPHHAAYAICERRVAEGWLPLTRSLEIAAQTAGWLILMSVSRGLFVLAAPEDSPLQVDGHRAGKSGFSGRPFPLFWGRENDLHDLAERPNSQHLRSDVVRLSRAAARCHFAREPWWIAWKRAASAGDLFAGIIASLPDNTPSRERRGDLTP